MGVETHDEERAGRQRPPNNLSGFFGKGSQVWSLLGSGLRFDSKEGMDWQMTPRTDASGINVGRDRKLVAPKLFGAQRAAAASRQQVDIRKGAETPVKGSEGSSDPK